jgi:hypothetical protein
VQALEGVEEGEIARRICARDALTHSTATSRWMH